MPTDRKLKVKLITKEAAPRAFDHLGRQDITYSEKCKQRKFVYNNALLAQGKHARLDAAICRYDEIDVIFVVIFSFRVQNNVLGAVRRSFLYRHSMKSYLLEILLTQNLRTFSPGVHRRASDIHELRTLRRHHSELALEAVFDHRSVSTEFMMPALYMKRKGFPKDRIEGSECSLKRSFTDVCFRFGHVNVLMQGAAFSVIAQEL